MCCCLERAAPIGLSPLTAALHLNPLPPKAAAPIGLPLPPYSLFLSLGRLGLGQPAPAVRVRVSNGRLRTREAAPCSACGAPGGAQEAPSDSSTVALGAGFGWGPRSPRPGAQRPASPGGGGFQYVRASPAFGGAAWAPPHTRCRCSHTASASAVPNAHLSWAYIPDPPCAWARPFLCPLRTPPDPFAGPNPRSLRQRVHSVKRSADRAFAQADLY